MSDTRINPIIAPVIDKLAEMECRFHDLQEQISSLEALRIPQLMNTKEVANYLGLSRQTIFNKVSLGEIPYLKKGGRVYFRKEAIDQWLQEGEYRP